MSLDHHDYSSRTVEHFKKLANVKCYFKPLWKTENKNRALGHGLYLLEKIFNLISLKVCIAKEQQQRFSARNFFFLLEKKYMGINEKLKSKGFFWRAASVSVGVLSLIVWDTILQSEKGSSKQDRDKADENRASASPP